MKSLLILLFFFIIAIIIYNYSYKIYYTDKINTTIKFSTTYSTKDKFEYVNLEDKFEQMFEVPITNLDFNENINKKRKMDFHYNVFLLNFNIYQYYMKILILFLFLIGIILAVIWFILNCFSRSKEMKNKIEYEFVLKNVYDGEINDSEEQLSFMFNANDVRNNTNLI